MNCWMLLAYLCPHRSTEAQSLQIFWKFDKKPRVTHAYKVLHVLYSLQNFRRSDGLKCLLWPVAVVNAVVSPLKNKTVMGFEMLHAIFA